MPPNVNLVLQEPDPPVTAKSPASNVTLVVTLPSLASPRAPPAFQAPLAGRGPSVVRTAAVAVSAPTWTAPSVSSVHPDCLLMLRDWTSARAVPEELTRDQMRLCARTVSLANTSIKKVRFLASVEH